MLSSELAPRTSRGSGGRLAVVVSVETAERISYFALAASLALHVSLPVAAGGLGAPVSESVATVGAYGAALYLASLLGGWSADRVLGAVRTLFAGAVLVPLGLAVLVLVTSAVGLGIGLLLMAVGAGAIKATTATIVGGPYTQSDPRRSTAFTVYYTAINGGSLIGGITALLSVQSAEGFRALMLASAIVALVAAATNAVGSRDSLRLDRPEHPTTTLRILALVLALLTATVVIAMALATAVVSVSQLTAAIALTCLIAAAVVLVHVLRSPSTDRAGRRGVRLYLVLFAASVLQVTLLTQVFTVLMVHASTAGDEVATALQLGIVLGPTAAIGAAVLWRKRGGAVRPASGYARCLALMAGGFGALVLCTAMPNEVLGLMLALVVPVFFVADLLASPQAMAFVTAIAPPAFRGQLLSVHYLTYAIGSALSGLGAAPYEALGATGYFFALAAVALAAAVTMTMARRYVEG